MQTFLFGPYPQDFELFDIIATVDILGALLLGIILWLVLTFRKVNRVSQKLIQSFKNLSFTYGLVGLLWLVFRYEGASYLEWRFWMVLIMVAALIWFVKILIYWLGGYKKEMAQLHERQRKEKYLR